MIQFKEVQKDRIDINGFLYSYSECGTLQVFIMPVVFGFRVRAGYVKETAWCALDYCGGDRHETVQALYTLVVRALERTGGDFSQFPPQQIKPFPLDIANFTELVKLSGAVDHDHFSVIELGTELYWCRQQYYELLRQQTQL